MSFRRQVDEEKRIMSEDVSDGSDIYSAYKYKCSFTGCDLEFRRKDRLDSHEYTHTQVKKFKCTEENCGKSYITSSHLQRHKRTAHSKSTEIVQCSFASCDAFFYSDASMKTHCRDIHSEKLREFECEICNEKFRRKTQLRQHMFAHTGHYRYACDKCGKGFLMLSRLKNHEHSHRIRKCDLCDASFDKWSLLLVHRRKEHTNTDHQCSDCDRKFHSKRGLRNHRKTHATLEDRDVCQCTFDGCTRTFFQKKNMLAHYKIKHENRKFVCSFDGCKSKLSTKQKLEQHVKVVHLNEGGKKSQKESNTTKSQRKDKGVQKRSTASKFFKVILPPEFEKAIISGQGKNIHLNYDRTDSENDDERADQGAGVVVAQLNSTNLKLVVEC